MLLALCSDTLIIRPSIAHCKLNIFVCYFKINIFLTAHSTFHISLNTKYHSQHTDECKPIGRCVLNKIHSNIGAKDFDLSVPKYTTPTYLFSSFLKCISTFVIPCSMWNVDVEWWLMMTSWCMHIQIYIVYIGAKLTHLMGQHWIWLWILPEAL